MEPEKKHSIIDKVYNGLIGKIMGDSYQVGNRLPTESAICEEYGVGRSTVREAARLLQAEGFIEIKRGSGMYVKSKTYSIPNDSIRWLLDNRNSIRDFMDVRIVLEVLSVKLFIQRAEESIINELKDVQRRFEHATIIGNVDMMTKMDEEFHKIIAIGSKNDLLINVNALLNEAFKKYRYITFSEMQNSKWAVDAHNKIIDSIERHDTNDATYDIKEHLMTSAENAIIQAGL